MAAEALVVVFDSVECEEPAELVTRLSALLERFDVPLVICDLQRAEANLRTLDALIRLEFAAKRQGRALQLQYVSSDLRDLLIFTGFDRLFRCRTGQAERQ